MRRVYHINPHRKRITQEAILNMRAAREAIDPELLAHARKIIEETAVADVDVADDQGKVPVDRKKNLSIIMKFMALQPENTALHKEVDRFLKNES